MFCTFREFKNIKFKYSNLNVIYKFYIIYMPLYLLSGDKPEIAALNFPSNVIYGKRTAVTCTVIDGDPPFSFSWFKDGVELKETQGIFIQEASDGFTSTLSIAKVEAISNGNYSCRVKNSKGMEEKHDVLLVKGNELIFRVLFFTLSFHIVSKYHIHISNISLVGGILNLS